MSARVAAREIVPGSETPTSTMLQTNAAAVVMQSEMFRDQAKGPTGLPLPPPPPELGKNVLVMMHLWTKSTVQHLLGLVLLVLLPLLPGLPALRMERRL
jgi:hypothetical protein